ncbi:hypothetical protein ACXYTJ_15425 [Gilvimarinus sp. F26214L]|uniref:hypothetical protein n=1 Tax=Gilvimarinus sp. DZF01 TaxID=3461371 RepID=UPI004045F2A8
MSLYNHTISQVEFQEIVAGIEDRIPSLTDRQVAYEFMRLLGSVSNGHNFIVPAFGAKGAFQQLPFQFYWFSGGLYIVEAKEEYREWIGYKVTSFGATSVDEALVRTGRVNARDNEMQQRLLGPYYLSLPTVLEGLGIVDDSRDITLSLEGPSGGRAKIEPAPVTLTFSGFPVLPPPTNVAPPTYLANHNENYWATLLPGSRTLFVQVNAIQNMASESLNDFSLRLRSKLASEQIDHFVLDLRHNSGGNGSLNPPLLSTLVLFEGLKPDGKLFVLIGRNTFSAAHTLLVDIDRLTDAILVGEPSGSRPNAMSESGWFQLPYSGITGIVSSQFHQSGAPEDHRIWIAPHVPVDLTAVQYFEGRDPAMEAVNEIIARGE